MSELQIFADWLLVGAANFFEGLNIAKFLLGVVTITFDIIMIFQHYVLYKDKKSSNGIENIKAKSNNTIPTDQGIISKANLPVANVETDGLGMNANKWNISPYLEQRNTLREMDNEQDNQKIEYDSNKFVLPKKSSNRNHTDNLDYGTFNQLKELKEIEKSDSTREPEQQTS